MSGLFDLCESYFGSRNFYDVLKIDKSANDKQVKKAYHKLSLLVHPDRVKEEEQIEATEKFKVLGRIYTILSDKEKRSIYDESGEVDEEGDEVNLRNWSDYWRALFKEVTVQDITDYEKNYKNSETERNDLKKAYVNGKGDMDYIFESVPFTNSEEEPRLREIIEKLIEEGEVEEYDAFTNESKKKKDRRRNKWAKEAQEVEKMKRKKKAEQTDDNSDLALAIQNRAKDRRQGFDNFLDNLAAKYSSKKTKKDQSESPTKTSRKRKA